MGARIRNLCSVLLALTAIAIFATRYVKASVRSPELVENSKRLVGRELGTPQLRLIDQRKPEPVKFVSGRRQLLLVFTPECAACQLARPQWESLASQLPPHAIVGAISLQPDDQHTDTARFFSHSSIREWRASAATLVRFMPARVVPITVVIAPNGTIERAEAGVPSQKAIEELKRLLADRNRP